MRFNTDEFPSDNNFKMPEGVDSEYVTEQSMNALWEMVIEPMEEKLSDEDKSLIGIIGVTLKLVAHKATLYENLQNGTLDENYLN